MPEATEIKLGAFMLELKGIPNLSQEVFVEKYPHPFLMRDVEILVKLDESKVKEDANKINVRLQKLLAKTGSSAAYALGMVGASSVKQVAQRSAKTEETRTEKRMLPLTTGEELGPGRGLTLGTDESRGLVFTGDLAEGISARHAIIVRGFTLDQWRVVDDGSDFGTFVEGGRVHKGIHRIVDAEILRLGSVLEMRFFSPAGMFGYLMFHSRLSKAKAKVRSG